MTTRDRHPLSIWLHEFKTVWLPAELPNDAGLLHSISNKLGELERLIPGVDEDEEYYRDKLLHDHSSSNSDTEHIIVAPTCPTAHQLSLSGGSLPTPPEVQHSFDDDDDDEEEQRAKLILLEQSDDDDHVDLFHPSIRLQRMPREESEPYLPVGWAAAESPLRCESTSSSTSEDEYTIRKRLKKPLNHSKTSASKTQIPRRTTQTSHPPNDVFINFNPPSLPDPLPLVNNDDDNNGDVDSLDNQEIFQDLMDNDEDAESILDFLDLTSEAAPIPPVSLADPPIDSLSTEEDSLDERSSMEVPSYAHLLCQSKPLSSDSNSDTGVNEGNTSKRSAHTSSGSEVSPVKKKKNKTLVKQRVLLSSSSSSDEQSSTEQSSGSTTTSPTKAVNRTRIQRSSSSSSSDEGVEGSSPNKGSQGRKNIRKIIDDRELDIQTKEAIEAEQERRKRIAEKQKKYNDTLLDQSYRMSPNSHTTDNPVDYRLILELDKTTNEPLIEVSPELVRHLKPHQCDGIRFLWNNVFESIEAVESKKSQRNGCILAHCMGLGKTLQVISFIHTVLISDRLPNARTCLVLCPINAALNWSNELEHWLKNIEPAIDHYQLATVKPHLRVSYLTHWYENGGVMVMGYEMYRRLANGSSIAKLDAFKCLVDPGPDIVVADEGHILKNSQTALAKCLSKIKTFRRIVLTGTPLQNNLIEYYCMVSFIKPNLLGSQQEYINRFVNPIQNGQHRDSNEVDVRLMKRRACVLHELLTGFIDRQDYSLLKGYLPPKFEYIIHVRLSNLQSILYEIYLKRQVNREQRLSVLKQDFKSAKLFADYQYLQKIWTHPFLLYPHFIERWKKRLPKDDDKFIDDLELQTMFADEEDDVFDRRAVQKKRKASLKRGTSGFLIDNIEDELVSKKRRASSSSTTVTTLDSDSAELVDDTTSDSKSKKSDDDVEIIKTYPSRRSQTKKSTEDPWLDEMREEFWFPFLDALPDASEFDVELSGKFLLLKSILEKCASIGDKILLFSRSLYTLNYIERFLSCLQMQNEQAYRRELRDLGSSNEHVPEPVQWTRDLDYFRMDGQTDVMARKRYAKTFNNLLNVRARLFLISTLAGGIGINLTGSNRVIVFDASWNPSHDTQAIFRSYRFGQKKPVYIYRLLARGTMEEKIYQRQVVKQSLSQRVVDDHQLDRHFTQNDIKELYKFTAEPLPDAQPTCTSNFNYPIPKDHLLLDLLYEHQQWIHSYHSHDSLLENKLDEGLSVEERRRALEEYENLKHVPDPRQLAMQRVQQQQQLNALIAQQRQAATTTMATPAYTEVLRTLALSNGRNSEYQKILQMMFNRGSKRNNERPIQARQSSNATVARPTTTVTQAEGDGVIMLEGDEETRPAPE